MTPGIEEILDTIKDLPLKDALIYLVLAGIERLSEKGYEKIKKILQDKANEGRYAFVPNKEEANLLLQFRDNPIYRQIIILVPKYRYIDIIRTGLLIDYYHKHDTPENRRRVAVIKYQIKIKPNGNKLLKLVDFPTTPFFSIVLQYLYEQKTSGFSTEMLEEKFSEIVDTWEKTSKLVESRNEVKDVISFCKKHMEKKTTLFFLLGMKTASKIVEKAVTEMEKHNLFEQNKYTYKLTKSEEGNQPRTEVMIYPL
jgi:hypothetical protein